MTAFLGLLSSAAAAATLAIAAPAVAQYYPDRGYGYDYGNGYGYGYPERGDHRPGIPYAYEPSRQVAINSCATAAQERLGTNGTARVLGISDASRRTDGGMTVRGVASSGRYGYGYAMQPPVDLTWRCLTDFRGVIRQVTIDPANSAYGNYTDPWDDDFTRFGYRRY